MLVFTPQLLSVTCTSILNLLFIFMLQKKMLVSNNYESGYDLNSRRE